MSEPIRPLAAPYMQAGEIPPAPTPIEAHRANSRLNDTAETIGSAVGSAVETVRQLPQRLQDMKRRLTVIRGRARREATVAAGELKETAEEKAIQARTRAQYLAHEYPVQVILGAAATAFVLGFVLRIWRSNRG